MTKSRSNRERLGCRPNVLMAIEPVGFSSSRDWHFFMEPRMFTVELTDAEVMVAKMLGGLRSIVGRTAGVTDRKVANLSGLAIDEDGMIAEYAFCKHFNIFPDIVPGPRSGSYDCIYNGKRIDVKSTRYHSGRLLATLKDNPDVDIYVLGIVDGNKVYFPGYATKATLCDDENKVDLGRGVGYALEQDRLTAFAPPPKAA